MDIYNYDSISGEFISTGKADPDPLQSDSWLLPAWATTEEPLEAGEHQVSVMSESGWVLEADYRGPAWRIDTREKITIKDIGSLPVNVTDQEPGQFDTWNGSAWEPDYAAMDKTLAAVATQRLDTLCDEVYTRYASRATRYEQKHREALDNQAGVNRAYHYLPAEASARGVSVDDMAAMVITAANLFNEFGAAAEAARAGLPGLVAAAKTQMSKQQAIDTLVQQLETAAQGL